MIRKEFLDKLSIAAHQNVKERDYWLARLSGGLVKGSFVYDGKRAAGKRVFALEKFGLDRELFLKLMELGAGSDYTLHLILTAGLAVLLSRFTRSEDMVIGTPVYKPEAGREFINTVLPLRVRLCGGMTFKELLLAVRQTVIEAVAHQNYPLEILASQLNMPFSEEDDCPLFDTALLLKNIQTDKHLRHLNLNMVFLFHRGQESLEGTVAYHSLRWDKRAVRRIVGHLKRVLGSALSNIELPIAAIDILSGADKRQLLFDFDNTAAGYPEDRTIQALFEERVAGGAGRIAVEYEGEVVSYGELNRQANRLARVLRVKQVGRNKVIGMILEPSLEMITVIMGILKAGGAYLPIEPRTPAKRILAMLADCQAAMLLGQTAGFIPGMLILDDIRDWLSRQPTANVEAVNDPADIAYIIYTSGTTGRPKGVMIEHRNVVRLMTNDRHPFDFCRFDVWTMFHSCCFDFSVWEMYGALLYGGRLILVPRLLARNPEKYLTLLKKHGVTVLNQTPTAFYNLVNEESVCREKGLNLRYVIFGGEALKPARLKQWRNRYPRTRLINMYGITETTVHVTFKEIGEPEIELDISNIGRPIPTLNTYVLDDHLNVSPIGVPGELCVGGAGLARGYLNRVEWTHSKFGPDPFRKGCRIYRSGDLARVVDNGRGQGELEYLGRIDLQVKIRGYRIEPAEIESQLLRHKNIREAAVVTRQDETAGGQAYLCAYIAAADPADGLNLAELRGFLSQELPDYMIPARFILIDRLPLGASGKIDYRLLRDMDGLYLDSGAAYAAPANEIEEKLAAVWQSVLGREKIGTTENFFAIGGDSVKAIRIVSRMRKLGCRLEMKDMFQYPSIAQLAPRVTKTEGAAAHSLITGVVPLTPFQRDFLEGLKMGGVDDDRGVVLWARESFDGPAVGAVFKKIMEHHDALRTTFGEKEGRLTQTNHGSDYPLLLKVTDLRGREDAAGVVEAETTGMRAGFNLPEGPLMKLTLFHLDEGDRLVIVLHRLIADNESWPILLEDFDRLYRQYKRGEELTLPPKTDSFKLWCEQLRQYGEADGPGGEAAGIEWETSSFTLTDRETALLLTRSNEAFGTRSGELLLTALGLGLKECWGQSRLSIVLQRSGRQVMAAGANLERTVGCFTCSSPMILDFSFEADLSRQVKEVKESVRLGRGQRGSGDINVQFFEPLVIDREPVSFDRLVELPGKQRLNIAGGCEMAVTGRVLGQRLTLSIAYDCRRYAAGDIDRLLHVCRAKLSRVINHCCTRQGREVTPSDLTYKELSIEALAELTSLYPLLEDIYPLTPMQEGMFFHSVYDRTSSAYFGQVSFRLQGNLHVELVERSLNELFKRHDILRTAFIQGADGKLLQVVLKERLIDFYYRDISGTGDKAAYLAGYRERDRKNVFDLSQDVLMRFAVFKLAPSMYESVWSQHHILMDGWCTGLLIAEFFDIYRGFLENRQPPLPPQTPYRVYIEWLQRQDRQASQAYWRRYLTGYEELASLPGSKALKFEGEEDRYRDEQFVLGLEAGLTTACGSLAGKNRVTLNTLIQTVWAIVLAKYNGRNDVVFGGVVAGRPAEIEGVESMIGLFINTVPVRIRFGDGAKFDALLQRVQQEALESEPHHYYPLVKIQAESPLRQNLLDHILAFENYPLAGQIEGKIEFSAAAGRRDMLNVANTETFEHTHYDFNIIVVPGDQLHLLFKYNARLYEAGFIERTAGQVKRILNQVVKRGDNDRLTVRELSLLSAAEKRQILIDFNDTARELPPDNWLLQPFERRVNRDPHRVALAGSTGLVSVRELDNRANRLARFLRSRGLGPNTTAGIRCERSIEMVVAMFGVLKTGGAYLPIDPAYPEERLVFMLEDSSSRVLLTHGDRPKGIGFAGEVIDLEDDAIYRQGNGHVSLPVGGDDLAYVIYTSGSTGRPKGVMVEQRGVINILYCLEALYPLRQQDAYLLKTNYCFDVSVTEIFGWFFGKGRLVVLDVNMEKEPGAMVGVIDRFGVTHINFVPSMLTAFLDALQDGVRERLKSLKYIFVAGEAFTVPLSNRLIDLNLPIRFENIFGPTEATIYSAAYSLPPLPPGHYLEVVPIGRSLHNIKNYIVDDALNLQPVDIPAELCIGGVGLARGYLNRPELTAEKFVPAPFAGGERLYRTGDLARFLPDGNIDCLGRRDHQVKVRGFRVELAEIESHLLGYGDIKEAAVLSFERSGSLAAEDGGGDKYICAYIVADRTVDLPGLREFLARRLPDFMIPAYFKQLEGLPLTASGKIDRPALPEPGALSSADYVPPRDRLEKRLAEIWQELLGVERVGINDNFFELGGDSIKAIQVASRLQRSGLKLESRYIFLNPFIGELKRYVGRMDRAIDQGVVGGRAPLSPIQGWFFRHCRTDRHHFNQAVLLQRRPGFDEETIRQVFARIVAHHDALRMVFSEEEGTIVQQNRGLLQDREREETLFGLDVVDLRQVADLKDLAGKIAEAANRIQRSLDPAGGPLVKLGLFRTGEGDLLLIVIHHLVIDGVSWRILLEDFTVGYRQVQQKQAIKLQDKTDSFQYWCRRLPEYAGSRHLSKEIDYWRGLDGIDCKKLAVDHEIGPAKKRYGNVESVPVTLCEEYTGKLLKEVNRAYRTDINDILMAALGLAIKAWANLEKVAVTFEGHGREDVVRDIDISRTIGWFTSLYPLVLDMADTADLAYTVKSVKETLRRVPNRGVGYGILRYLTDGVEGEEVRFQLEPEIVFNYLGQFGPANGRRSRGGDEALFEMSGLGVGESISPRLEREHKLDVGGILLGGRLSVAFGYNKYEYDRPNIDRLARLFESNLVEVIDHCCRKPARELTPSDVGCPGMSIRGLEKIQAALGSGAEISWIYPLTAMQAGMLFHWLKDSASTASTVYHEQTVFFIEGEIDADLLARSFNILISRYDILRTAFIHEGLEDPVQVVLKERTARLAFEDISHLDSQRRGQYLEEIKRNNLQQGFDPAQDLLVRLSLVRVGPGACCLILDFFHIIMDGWCLPIIYRELIQIYQLLGQGKAPDLPPVNQYIEYIRWLESQDRRAGLRYWQAYLEGVEKPTVLPRCRTVDPVGDENRSAYEPAEYSFTLDDLQTEGLQRLAREIRVTVNTVLQTLWGILLQKYNDTDDVVWGTLVSGRPPEIEGIENMVGLFINTVPIRLRSEADQEVSSLLARVQQETALSRGYEYVPLAEIQAGSTLKRDLIDHIWAFENYPVPGELKQPGQSRQPAGFNIVNFQAFEQTNYDFCVIVSRDRHFRVRFNYNAAVYDRPFVEKVAANFSGIIGQVVANRRIKIAGIAAAHDLLAAKANLDREAYSDFGF